MNTTHRAERVILMLLFSLLVGFAASCRSSDERTSHAQARSAAPFDSAMRVVLPIGLPPDLLGRCDRAYKGGKTPSWVPPLSLVQNIDERLAALLDSVLLEVEEESGRTTPLPTEYYRQYAGVTQRGSQWVHINGFHRSMLTAHEGAATSDTVLWRLLPVAPCDGGVWRFGVMYDVRNQRFTPLEFTDSYDGPIRY